jgi:hypothetical protein
MEPTDPNSGPDPYVSYTFQLTLRDAAFGPPLEPDISVPSLAEQDFEPTHPEALPGTGNISFAVIDGELRPIEISSPPGSVPLPASSGLLRTGT